MPRPRAIPKPMVCHGGAASAREWIPVVRLKMSAECRECPAGASFNARGVDRFEWWTGLMRTVAMRRHRTDYRQFRLCCGYATASPRAVLVKPETRGQFPAR